MTEEKMLVKATNKDGTEVYYLGNFGRQSLQRNKLPNVDSRLDKYQESINIRSDNRHRVKKQKTSYSKNILQQQVTSIINSNRVVSHHRQQRRLEPARNHPFPAPTKNCPNASLNNPPKQSTVNLPVTTSLKNPTRALPVTTSLKNTTIVLPVTKNQKNPDIPQPKSPVIMSSWIQTKEQFEMAANHILHSIHSTNQHSSH
jgi:hypothetical protein